MHPSASQIVPHQFEYLASEGWAASCTTEINHALLEFDADESPQILFEIPFRGNSSGPPQLLIHQIGICMSHRKIWKLTQYLFLKMLTNTTNHYFTASMNWFSYAKPFWLIGSIVESSNWEISDSRSVNGFSRCQAAGTVEQEECIRPQMQCLEPPGTAAAE